MSLEPPRDGVAPASVRTARLSTEPKGVILTLEVSRTWSIPGETVPVADDYPADLRQALARWLASASDFDPVCRIGSVLHELPGAPALSGVLEMVDKDGDTVRWGEGVRRWQWRNRLGASKLSLGAHGPFTVTETTPSAKDDA